MNLDDTALGRGDVIVYISQMVTKRLKVACNYEQFHNIEGNYSRCTTFRASKICSILELGVGTCSSQGQEAQYFEMLLALNTHPTQLRLKQCILIPNK